MLPPVYFLYGVLFFAVVALLVNIYVKLPKNVFVFLVIFTLVATCWTAMEGPGNVTARCSFEPSQQPADFILAESVSLCPGVNNFRLSFAPLPGKCKGAAYSLNFEAGQGGMINHLNCVATLHGIDGRVLDSSAVYSRENSLKFVFMFPDKFDFAQINCLRFVCTTGERFKIRNISEEKFF